MTWLHWEAIAFVVGGFVYAEGARQTGGRFRFGSYLTAYVIVTIVTFVAGKFLMLALQALGVHELALVVVIIAFAVFRLALLYVIGEAAGVRSS